MPTKHYHAHDLFDERENRFARLRSFPAFTGAGRSRPLLWSNPSPQCPFSQAGPIVRHSLEVKPVLGEANEQFGLGSDLFSAIVSWVSFEFWFGRWFGSTGAGFVPGGSLRRVIEDIFLLPAYALFEIGKR